MDPRRPDPRTRRPGRPWSREAAPRLRLAKLAVALILVGSIASGIELVVLGHLTPAVLALDGIGWAFVPLGLIAMFARPTAFAQPHRRGGDDHNEDDESGGGGSSRGDERRPLGPDGGLDIEWGRFEREFQAYARRVARPLEPSRA